MTTLEHRTPLHLPALQTFEQDGISYAVDPAKPNWIAVDGKGRELLDAISASAGKLTFGALVARYAATNQLEAGKAWVHVHDFLRALDRAGMLAEEAVSFSPYPGRAALIAPEGLRELWIQRKENVVFLGPPGVGKTHLAISLAIAAAQKGRRVYYGTLADLIASRSSVTKSWPPL